MLAGLLIATAAAGAPSSSTTPVFAPFGFDEAGMDRAVKPGDDFYRYANGAWQERTAIPADRSSVSMYSDLEERSLQQTRGLLEAAAAHPGSRMGDFYASFLDEAAADQKGAAPMAPFLEAIAARTDRSGLAALAARLQRQGVPTFYGVPGPLAQAVSPDDKNPKAEIFRLHQAGLGLPNRDYYLGGKFADARKAYLAYATRLFELAGLPGAPQRARAVLAVEQDIARVHWTAAESRVAEKTYNRWSPKDFDRLAPGFDWSAYLKELGVGGQPAILIAQPSAISAEARIWGRTPAPVLQDILRLRLLDTYAPYLSQPFVVANFAFHGSALSGTPNLKPRWERGVELVSRQLRDDVGQAYVGAFFPPQREAAARDLVGDVIAAWRIRLQQNRWMAPRTRSAALRKLAALQPEVGHPRRWRTYAGLQIRRDDLVGDVARSFEWEFQHQLDKLGAPADRDDWNMTAMHVDAEEDPVKNAIYIPAAILQAPYFDPAADAAVNYGAIGSFIGHEISHGFDDQGRKYDAEGRLSSWWTPADVAHFKRLTQKLVRQYDAYAVLPGEHVDGRLVLGETMADLGGVTVGRLAYSIHLQGKAAPVVAGYTPDQRFYLGWAQIWRTKIRDAALVQQLHSDPHPPGPTRADTVRNRDDWYRAFGVTPGRSLYLAPKDRVQVW